MEGLFAKILNVKESPVKELKILHLTGFQKPGFQQNKKLKLMSVEFIKFLDAESSALKTENKINERGLPKPKKLGKHLSKLRSDDAADNTLSSILSHKRVGLQCSAINNIRTFPATGMAHG